MSEMKYYVLEIWGDLEPSLHEATDEDNQFDLAQGMRNEDPEKNNGIYSIDINFETKEVKVNTFALDNPEEEA